VAGCIAPLTPFNQGIVIVIQTQPPFRPREDVKETETPKAI
jgi:hypothetical protein